MALQDEDKEYLWQLSWIYPGGYITELESLAEAVIKEQLAGGERQNIREIVWGIMAKIQPEQENDLSEAAADDAAAAQAEAEAVIREKVLAALRDGQPHLPAEMGPEVIGHLVEALAGKDELAANAREALTRLTDGSAIDTLCGLWAESRNPHLEQIILDAGYLASQPLGLRLLTVLKTGADRRMLAEGPALIPELLAAVDDADRSIAGRARRLLLTLTDRQAINAVCEMVLAGENERLKHWAAIARYAPATASKAALYYCITGQWENYYALDWQETRPLLTKGYNQATPAERQLFLAAARGSGHSLLLAGLLLEGGSRDEYEELTDDDWAAMLDMLVSQERWQELYRLTYRAPAGWAAEIVLALDSAGWVPKNWEYTGWEKICANCPPAGRELFVPAGRQPVMLETQEVQAVIECVAIHPNGRIVAGGGSDGRLRLWQVASGSLWRTVDLHTDGITAITFTPDGRYLVTAGREAKVHVWHMPDIKWVSSVSGQPGLVTAITADNGGRLLALACPGGVLPARVWTWDGAYMNNRGQYPGSLFAAGTLNLEQSKAAGGGRDGKIRIYTLAGGKGGNRSWAAHAGPVKAMLFSGDGRLLITHGADDMIKVWTVEGSKLLWSAGCSGRLLAVSRDAAVAAVAGPEGSIALQQLRFTKPLALATHADWQQALVLLAAPECPPEARQATAFFEAVLAAKFRYDITLA